MKPIPLTPNDALNLLKRSGQVRSWAEIQAAPAEREQRQRKYGNVKVKDGDRVFDSKAEHRRWLYLVAEQKAGRISDLKPQVPFELIPAQVAPSGAKHRPTVYLADFVYVRDGKVIVEDVKGAVTPEFRLKRKLMLLRFGIEVQEVRS